MKIVSICLARKGSKRLKNKNIKLFCGKPLIHYTADLMNKLGYESWIFTDFQEITTYITLNFPNINMGIKPKKFAQDIHYTDQELLFYNKKLNADIFIYLACTSPIRDVVKIKNSLDVFLNNLDKYDCVLGVRKLKDRMYYMDGKSCNFDMKERTFVNSTTPKNIIYEETGSLYIFKKELLKNNFFINDRCLFIDDMYNFDIDTETDFKKAENYYKEFLYEKNNI